MLKSASSADDQSSSHDAEQESTTIPGKSKNTVFSQQQQQHNTKQKYNDSSKLAAKFHAEQSEKMKSASPSLNALSKYDDKELLKQSIKDVEKKFKSRELQEIEIYSISLNNLTSAHKFSRNSPWCKCTWGETESWIAEYQHQAHDDDDKNSAEWIDLKWRFVLPRNEADRKDLIVTVCSQDVIIGRYALLAKDFANIPESQSGYFEVSGEVRNAIGFAG
jgi:hypothetical protein